MKVLGGMVWAGPGALSLAGLLALGGGAPTRFRVGPPPPRICVG